MSRIFLACICLLSWIAVAAADRLDPELNKPYRLQVVLRVGGNRQLTKAFKDQVERELRGNLRAALGDLAEVEVVRTHPRLAKIEAEGLQNGLNGWREVSGIKTHFVFIDFENDQYVLRARQHDGLTGLPSPLVREARISERQLVSRTATLLVDQDFGFVGTLTKRTGDLADIALKGGMIAGQDLGRWVKNGDVFAVAVITTNGQGFEVPWTLLQVTKGPREGVCDCRLLYRHTNPLPGGGTIRGYRCLRLATTKAPVRLHFYNEKAGQPLPAGLEIVVSQFGFKEDRDALQLSTETGGYLQTEKAFEKLAFVRVVSGGNQTVVRLPLAIVGDRTVECGISQDSKAEDLSELAWRRDRWLRQLYERVQLLQLLAKDLTDLIDKSAFPAAKEKATAGLEELKDELKNLQGEETALREAAQKLKLESRLDLGEGERLIQDLKTGQDRLAAHIKQIDDTIKEQANPERQKLQTLLHQAKLREDEADYGQALEKFDEALKQSIPVSDNIKRHIEDLRERWKPKDDEHVAARKFIYETWPGAKTAKEMDEQIADAHKALEKCKAVGDVLAPRKLLRETVTHVTQLDQELEALKAESTEDNQKKIEKVGEVAPKLKKLLLDTTEYLNKSQKPAR